MPLVLLYHDVVDEGGEDSSGFPGPGAARYKLTRDVFSSHIDAIAARSACHPITLVELDGCMMQGSSAPLLTFDDGGSSAFSWIAEALESRGWRGHFFITSDLIDSPGFVTPGQIRELRDRGHFIGTHSCSHPERMSFFSRDELLREWRRSREVLAEILDEPVTIGSVPGGYYSRSVAEAAALSGLEYLFTSEPTVHPHRVNGCTVLGRYTIYRGMSAREAASLAAGRALPRLRQALWWNIKKLAKRVAGHEYLRLRSRALGRVYRMKEL